MQRRVRDLLTPHHHHIRSGTRTDGIERYSTVTWIRTRMVPLVGLLLCLLMLSGCVPSCCGTHVINNLAGVFALSTDDVWAVGGTTTDSGNYGTMTTLIEHWDGTHWSVVPNPSPDIVGLNDTPLSLTAVAGSAPDDIWAVGRSAGKSPDPVVEHWNGRAWQASRAPCLSQCTSSVLNAVVALSATDAWAVGEANIPPEPNGYPSRPLVEHWNGTQWALVPGGEGLSGDTIPNYALSNAGVLDSIVALSDTDVWVVGLDAGYYPHIAHWNGESWQVVANATGSGGALQLPIVEYNSSLSAASASASAPSAEHPIWVAGTTSPCGQCAGEAPLILVGSGKHWVPSLAGQLPPDSTGASPSQVRLQAVEALSPSDVWVVGLYQGSGTTPSRGFTAQWDGTRWHILPTAQKQTAEDLASVTAVSTTDLWAVGARSNNDSLSSGDGSYTLIEHWNGTQWTVVPSPDPGVRVQNVCM